MITRFRFEAIGDDKETVEEELDETQAVMVNYLRVAQPKDEWELTDNPISPIEKDGRAQMYGRRVFRRTDKGGTG